MNFDEFKTQFDSFDDRPFARGGQKEVYGAKHSIYGDVVVKILEHCDERANREISIVSENSFEHVPQIFGFSSLEYRGGVVGVIVEQRIRGVGLRDVIRSGKRYELPEIVDFLEQALSFIGQISEKGIVHRDIKPENIIIANDGQLYFLDFGIARLLDATSITATNQGGPFTPGYAAPEVMRGQREKIDTRADLFSVGVVAYELITGENPFTRRANGNPFNIYMNTITITPVQHRILGDSQSQLMGLISALMSKTLFMRPKDAKQASSWLDSAKTTFRNGDDGQWS